MRSVCMIVVLGLLTGCSAAIESDPRAVEGAPAPALGVTTAVGIDAVMLGINDLQRGVEELERRTGVRAAYGGAHPGMGTHNALLSLGEGQYLEIIAPNPQESVNDPFIQELQALQSLTPIYWSVQTDNVESLRADLERRGMRVSPAQPGSRERPDGTRLEWVTFGIVEPDHPVAPFFIRWTERSPHPSQTSPGGCTLESLRLEDPAPEALRASVEPLGLRVPVERGTRPRIRLVVSCPRGSVEFE